MLELDLAGGVSVADLPEQGAKTAGRRLAALMWRWSSHPVADRSRLSIAAQPVYSMAGVVRTPADAPAPCGHFLNVDHYAPRAFVTAQVRNVLFTRHAKAIGAVGRGFIEEFNVSGSAGIPRSLLAADLQKTDGDGYRVRARDLERVAGLSVPIGHYGIATFGHFVLDALLQVHLFEDALASGEAQLTHWPLEHSWMDELLSRCGAPPERRRVLTRPVALMQEAALSSALASHGVYFPGAYSKIFFTWLREKLLATTGASSRLYLRRPARYGRALKNQHALEELLVARGFAVLDPDVASVSEQAESIAGAEVVVAAWGSGLTFAPLLDGRRIIVELLPRSVTDPWFMRQAVVHGLDYRPVLIDTSPDGEGVVDLKAVLYALDK